MLIALGVLCGAVFWTACGKLAWNRGGTLYFAVRGVRVRVVPVSHQRRVRYALLGPIGVFQAQRDSWNREIEPVKA